jgi:hypothetical protein
MYNYVKHRCSKYSWRSKLMKPACQVRSGFSIWTLNILVALLIITIVPKPLWIQTWGMRHHTETFAGQEFWVATLIPRTWKPWKPGGGVAIQELEKFKLECHTWWPHLCSCQVTHKYRMTLTADTQLPIWKHQSRQKLLFNGEQAESVFCLF